MAKNLDRDISWIGFNTRVLDQASRKDFTKGENINFIGICHSNLDEFFMTRYPSRVKEDDNLIINKITDLAEDNFYEINERYRKHFNDVILSYDSIGDTSIKKEIEAEFKKNIYPTLTPMTIHNSLYPKSRTVNIFVETFDKNDKVFYNNIEIPESLGRYVECKKLEGYLLVEELVVKFLPHIFRDMTIGKHVIYRVVRNCEMLINDDSLDLYSIIEKSLKEREKAKITRIDVDEDSKKPLINILKSFLDLEDYVATFKTPIVDMSILKDYPSKYLDDNEKMRKLKSTNPFNEKISIFDIIKNKDQMVHHPYESFDKSVVRFIREAANDADTISIKITLYRLSRNSKIIDALLKAAEKGKSVTVLIELKARFDEKNNLQISRVLKDAGVNLVFTEDLKTHCKIALVTRKEKDKIRIYSHVGTGNYNEANARIYTDYSIFTANSDIGKDLSSFFNLLTSKQEPFKSRVITYAPHNMRKEIADLIDSETERAKKGKDGRIIIKCNSLTDDKISKKLYDAAKSGVKVTLIVRGACIMQPAKNIKIISLIGRFLEHSRIYIFGKGDREKIYVGSSDLMYRNLSLRYELLLFISDDDIKKRIKEHIKMYLSDTRNSYKILNDYTYEKRGKKKTIDCHEWFIKEANKHDI